MTILMVNRQLVKRLLQLLPPSTRLSAAIKDVTAKLSLLLLFLKLLTHNNCCQSVWAKTPPPAPLKKINQSILKQKRISKNVSDLVTKSDVLPKAFSSSSFHLCCLSHCQKFSSWTNIVRMTRLMTDSYDQCL